MNPCEIPDETPKEAVPQCGKYQPGNVFLFQGSQLRVLCVIDGKFYMVDPMDGRSGFVFPGNIDDNKINLLYTFKAKNILELLK